MSHLPQLVPAGQQRHQTIRQLQTCNSMTARFGLALSTADITALAQRREDLLQESGRLEFGGGILPKLVHTFCDSPTIAPHNYAATLDALLECFYHCKTEAQERITDDELLAIMKQQFDGPCQGSVELLGGTVLEALARAARFAPPGSTTWLEAALCPEEDPDDLEDDDM